MRIATWNLKQAVAPKKPIDQLWTWMEDEIDPDVIILTEAKVPQSGFDHWSTQWNSEGIGPRRKWGTVIAGRDVELRKVTEVKVGRRNELLEHKWPAIVEVADIIVEGDHWATIAGVYGLTVDLYGNSCGHGRDSIRLVVAELNPLFESDRFDRLIVAGDFNLWPCDVPRFLRTEMVDLVEATGHLRGPLAGCSGCDLGSECCHVWTHKNGNSPNAARQQIDFMFASPGLAEELTAIAAGVEDFPDAWDVSDHAPIIVEFGA
jgi:hypothetical protein